MGPEESSIGNGFLALDSAPGEDRICCYSYSTLKNNDDGATMSDLTTNRRRFLVAAITFSGLAAGTLGPSMLRLSSAWAQAADEITQSTLDAMVRMARLLYPHDAISDEVYAAVLDQVLASTAGDGSFAEMLGAAEEALNAQQPADFTELDEQAQIAAMQAIEGMDLLGAIQNAVRSKLYYHPAVWEHLGYEGPSFAKGGYLHRGSGDIDWLPEGE